MKLSYIKKSINTTDNKEIKKRIKSWINKGEAEQIKEGLWQVNYEDYLGNQRNLLLFFHKGEVALMV